MKAVSPRPRGLFVGAPDESETALTNKLARDFDLTMQPGEQPLPASGWPEVILVAAGAPMAVRRKVARWRRRRCAGALLGGFWREGLPAGRFDFFMVGDAQSATRLREGGVHPRRILLAGAKDAGEFLRGRLAAARRSLLWVEEDVSLRSPSTKHLVTSIPHLLEGGWEITVWSFTADPLDERVEVQCLPAPPRLLGMFAPYWFWLVANLRGLRRRMESGRREAAVVQTVGGAYLGADIAAIHFVNQLWLYRQLELGLTSLKAMVVFLWTVAGAGKDWLQFCNPRCRVFLPVSDSIAVEVRRRVHRGATVTVLPNSYDETRFNPVVRQQWRDPMRAELGFTPDETVFCFASQGHYQRKGFWLAVEALSRAADPKAKLLVIGGQPRTLDKLRARLDQSCADWAQWIKFTGTQSAVERYYSAADAFLFPSYFEAFCLAEIEAGALGLPLLLTPHNGTEMILRDGENGLLLSYDLPQLEKTLKQFLACPLPPFQVSPGRAMERARYAAELDAIYTRTLARNSGIRPPNRK